MLFIFLTMKDRFRLANFLGKPVNQFSQKSQFTSTRFAPKGGWFWYLKNIKSVKDDKNAEAQCPFLIKGKCAVYDVRPIQCCTFPFWPENMNMEKWLEVGKDCPGIGVGPELMSEQVELHLNQQVDADATVKSQPGR